jgi:hypothetical protein
MKVHNFKNANADINDKIPVYFGPGRAVFFFAIEPGDLEKIAATGGIYVDMAVPTPKHVRPIQLHAESPFFEDNPKFLCKACNKYSLRPHKETKVMTCINRDCPIDQPKIITLNS